MNISRYNYETCFILYIDNELSAIEKKAVEEFVMANPDLEEEFVMFQQSILKADDVSFDAKETLFKNEAVPAGLQQKLMLHLDNELNKEEQKEIEELINTDKNTHEEWQLIKQTKLTADNLVFKHKSLLYKKERGRIISLPWLRVAAAAVFIGVAIWGGVAYLSNGNKLHEDEVATKTNLKNSNKPLEDELATKANPSVPGKLVIKDTIAVQPSPKVQVIADENKSTVANAENKKNAIKEIKPAIQKIELLPAKRNAAGEIAVQTDNNLPKSSSDNFNNNNRNKTIASGVTHPKSNNIIEQPGNNEIVNDEEKTTGTSNTFVTAASLTESSEELNNDHVLFMNEEKLKKTKLGGMFRKVKRVFERNAKIKTGNNIKVANLEFAIQ